MMKSFALACVVLLLAHGGNADQPDACSNEDAALEACLIREGLGDVAETACDVCVGAAAALTYAIRNTTCDELATAENGLCVALGRCPCPAGCSAEMAAYALCEVNDELGLGCTTLECNVMGDGEAGTPPMSPAPMEAGGGTPTTAAPSETASTPTAAAPTEAASTPTEASTPTTEASPTATPTSMASATYTKIGAFAAGFLVFAALI